MAIFPVQRLGLCLLGDNEQEPWGLGGCGVSVTSHSNCESAEPWIRTVSDPILIVYKNAPGRNKRVCIVQTHDDGLQSDVVSTQFRGGAARSRGIPLISRSRLEILDTLKIVQNIFKHFLDANRIL
jgi:hypothetical protein